MAKEGNRRGQPPTGGAPGREEYIEYAISVPDHFRLAVEGVAGGIGRMPFIPGSVPATTFTVDISQATYLPRDVSILRPIYNSLRSMLDVPVEPREGSNDELNSSLSALAVTSSLLHQNELPMRDRDVFRDEREEFFTEMDDVATNFVRSASSNQARDELRETALLYMTSLHDSVATGAETHEQTWMQVNRMHTVLVHEDIDREEMENGFPEWSERMAVIRRDGLSSIAQNPHSTTLLLEGNLGEAHPALRGEALIGGIRRTPVPSGQEERQTAQQLTNFYLGDPEVHNYFLGRAYESNLEGFEPLTDFFFTQSPDIARRFILSTQDSDTENTGDDMNVRRLLGIVADFQNRHPDHENLRTMRNALDTIARRRDMLRVMAPALQVLQGNTPGSIFSSQNGAAWVNTPGQGESWEDFQARTADNREGIRRSLFDSPPRAAGVQVVAAAEPAHLPDRAKPVDRVEPAPQTRRLEITAGELPIGFRWPDAQRVRPGDIPRVLDHLQDQLDINEGVLLEQIVQGGDIADRGTHPTLLPEILPDTHMLSPLHELGVTSVESREGVFTIVIDGARANIASSGPGRILLQGRLDENNYLALEGAPDEFAETPLHLLLTEAARTTVRSHEPELAKGKNLERAKRRVGEYNAGIDPRLSPRMKPHLKGSVSAIDSATNAVLVPLGNDFAFAELDWGQLAA